MAIKAKIRIESIDRNVISWIEKHINHEFLSREFLVKNKIVEISNKFIETDTKREQMSFIEINCSGMMNKVLIPTLIDEYTVNYGRSFLEDIAITITPEDESKVGDIGNMVYEQFVGHQSYIDNEVVLNIDDGKNIRIWISKNSGKFPMFILTKIYTAFDK